MAARWSVLRVVEGHAVHVQRVSHDFVVVAGILKSGCLVERMNVVGELWFWNNATKSLKCSQRRKETNERSGESYVIKWKVLFGSVTH